jgi:hypothetical protein
MSFIISLIILTVCAFLATATSAKSSPVVAFAAAVAIATAGIASYSSYKEVLGRPVAMTWEEMPEEFTVIFFRIVGEDAIILWLDGDQLVSLPYNKDAKDSFEGERESMGSGIPSTFKGTESGEEGEEGEGEGGAGEGYEEGDGDGEDGSVGWEYELKSRGGQVFPGDLPPKSASGPPNPWPART